MKNIVTFSGALVRMNDLKVSQDGKSKFLYFTLVRNYRTFNKETEEWEENGSFFQDCLAFNRMAENIVAANLPKGTRLIVSGSTTVSPARTYTNKEGQEVDAPATENVIVDAVGISFEGWQVPTIEGNNKNTNYEAPAKKKEKAKTVEKESDVTSGLFDSEDDDEDDGDDFLDNLFEDL